ISFVSQGCFQGRNQDTIGPGAFTKIYTKRGTQIFGTRCT
ncbi:hypothetical protein Tco_0467001, partial [Tanacetum coccineum]